MTGCFLDTTIVIHLADGAEPDKTRSAEFVSNNQPAEMPYYALRELLAGHVQYICEVHNVIKAAENPGEALIALLNRSPAEGRKRESKIRELANSLGRAFTDNPQGDRQDVKRETLQYLALKASRVWTNAQQLRLVNKVQSLGCFNAGKIAYGEAGELRGPKDSFNCIKSERCAAAAYIYDNESALTKMIDALHPDNLSPAIKSKSESHQRRKALKELKSRGPKQFNKRGCRALGDAYFAAMCPAGSVVITSNIQDHEPLCSSIGKEAIPI